MSITTTGQKVGSYEEGYAHLYEFTTRMQGSYNYCMLMEQEDGSLTLVERVDMPCWGAIREYECGTRPNDPWPGDLRTERHIFPKKGKPVAISFQFNGTGHNQGQYHTKEEWNRFIAEFAFAPAVSPWRAALLDVELTIGKEDRFHGVVLKNTKFDPTVVASLMRNCGATTSQTAKKFIKLVDEKPDIPMAYHYLKARGNSVYGFSPRIEIDRFVDGNPYDMCEGLTFYERASYNRPDRDYIFGGKNNTGHVYSQLSVEKMMDIYNETKKKAA